MQQMQQQMMTCPIQQPIQQGYGYISQVVSQTIAQAHTLNPYLNCPSCIKDYISHLANNQNEYINLIICYLQFIILPLYLHSQDLSKFQLLLVIVGGNKSGKEIFFNNIIKSILGEKYCLDVDDDLFSKKDYIKEFDNKIFYNFNNISSKSMANKEKRNW
ncbi:MAG: hypothetical protein J6I71_00440 [Campylobacter sp.]|nr:hypothetical protein [Campylobacter sp.]